MKILPVMPEQHLARLEHEIRLDVGTHRELIEIRHCFGQFRRKGLAQYLRREAHEDGVVIATHLPVDVTEHRHLMRRHFRPDRAGLGIVAVIKSLIERGQQIGPRRHHFVVERDGADKAGQAAFRRAFDRGERHDFVKIGVRPQLLVAEIAAPGRIVFLFLNIADLVAPAALRDAGAEMGAEPPIDAFVIVETGAVEVGMLEDDRAVPIEQRAPRLRHQRSDRGMVEIGTGDRRRLLVAIPRGKLVERGGFLVRKTPQQPVLAADFPARPGDLIVDMAAANLGHKNLTQIQTYYGPGNC